MLLVSGITVGLLAGPVFSAQLVLEWDNANASNSPRYKVYYGTSSGNYQSVLDVGASTSCAISGLSEGATYFFAATTYDSSNNESGFSNEVSYVIPGGAQSPDPGTGGGSSSSGGSSSGTSGSNSSPAGTGGVASSASRVGDYVHHFYRQILNRDCAPVERSGWAEGLIGGSFSVADMAYGFFFSEEFLNRNLSNEEFAAVLYRGMFGREPDPGGYSAWVNALNGGANRQDVIAGFLNSPEFAGLCANYGINANASAIAGGGSLHDFVLRFYQLFLERVPGQPEVDGWVVSMSQGAIKGAGVAQGFIFSPEFMARNTSNEEYLSLLYRAFFNRDPDPGGYNGWLQFLNRAPLRDRATRQYVSEGFVTSAEFAQVCSRFGVAPF
jgi:hypothetical protein